MTVAELTGEIPVVKDGEEGEPASDGAEAAEAQPATESPAAASAQPVAGEPIEAEVTDEAPAEHVTEVRDADVTDVEVTEVAAEPEAHEVDAHEVDPHEAGGHQTDDHETDVQDRVGPASEHGGQAEHTGQQQPPRRASRVEGFDTAAFEAAAADPSGPDTGVFATRRPETPDAHAPEPQTPDAPAQAWSNWGGESGPGMATADFSTASVAERAGAGEPPSAEATEQTAGHAPDTASFSLSRIAQGDAPTEDLQGSDVEAARAYAAEYPDVQHPAGTGATDAVAEAPAKPARGRTALGWLALLGEVVLGLAAGAAVFFGFLQLWSWGGGAATMIFTVILAFVVIIALVTFTHFLRKTTDLLTLGLALLVGLVITFGPLLMYLSTRSA